MKIFSANHDIAISCFIVFRTLERQLGALCRAVAVTLAEEGKVREGIREGVAFGRLEKLFEWKGEMFENLLRKTTGERTTLISNLWKRFLIFIWLIMCWKSRTWLNIFAGAGSAPISLSAGRTGNQPNFCNIGL